MPISTDVADVSFVHDALPHSLTHIRLLEVLPQISPTDAQIRCRLRCARLADNDQSYTALSYAWQQQMADRTIQVNGQLFTVKENVYHFLRRHRHRLFQRELSSVFLWIDAICLDFKNIVERNAQATLMPSIFQKARDVIICLEPRIPAPTISQYSLDQLTTLFNRIQNDLQQERTPSNDHKLVGRYIRQDLQNACAERHANEWTTLLQICQQPYWSRLWILLETRYAQNIQIMYAGSIWPWQLFRAPFVLAKWLQEIHDLEGSLLARVLQTPVADVLGVRASSWHSFSTSAYGQYAEIADEKNNMPSASPLPVMLKSYRRRLCHDRLDRVYALVGLADTRMTIDYTRSNIELFCAVLLSLTNSPELKFVFVLAEQLDVSAFQYKPNRRSMIYGVPSTMPEQSSSDMIGHTCQNVLSVKLIPARTEISDILQSRLGLTKLKHYRITSHRTVQNMQEWDDMPKSTADLPRIHGHFPGTEMPIVDGFDLSETAFRPAIFLNPSYRNYKRKAAFGMISTSDIQTSDILVTQESMYVGLIIRISGLRKTWLTVVGVVLFARKVTVESDLNSLGLPQSSSATVRSTTLSDFCEHTYPTPFTITSSHNQENFTLKPHDMQIQSLFSGSSLSSGRHSRASSNTTNTTMSSKFRLQDRRLAIRSDRIERLIEVINPSKRRYTK